MASQILRTLEHLLEEDGASESSGSDAGGSTSSWRAVPWPDDLHVAEAANAIAAAFGSQRYVQGLGALAGALSTTHAEDVVEALLSEHADQLADFDTAWRTLHEVAADEALVLAMPWWRLLGKATGAGPTLAVLLSAVDFNTPAALIVLVAALTRGTGSDCEQAAELLPQLASADAVWAHALSIEPSVTANSVDMAVLQRKLDDHMADLIGSLLEQRYLADIVSQVAAQARHVWLSRALYGRASPHTEQVQATLASVCQFLVNLLVLGQARTAQLRKHVANDTGLVVELLAPYLQSASAASPGQWLAWPAVHACLQVMIAATYKYRALAPALLQGVVVARESPSSGAGRGRRRRRRRGKLGRAPNAAAGQMQPAILPVLLQRAPLEFDESSPGVCVGTALLGCLMANLHCASEEHVRWWQARVAPVRACAWSAALLQGHAGVLVDATGWAGLGGEPAECLGEHTEDGKLGELDEREMRVQPDVVASAPQPHATTALPPALRSRLAGAAGTAPRPTGMVRAPHHLPPMSAALRLPSFDAHK